MGPFTGEVWELTEEGCFVALTHEHLDVKHTMDKVRSPAAGAIVLFAGILTQVTDTLKC